jgi:hypothetical protein
MLNTQLASWAELRHDNILYAKQSVTGMALCDYPHGYVDPYPGFYTPRDQMAKKGLAAITSLPFVTAKHDHAKKYLAHVSNVAERLRAMAERERRNEPLTDDDLSYLNHMVSVDGRHAGCTTITEAGGWYAELFFHKDDALYHKPIISDVHTQPTDENGNPVGKVLHVATAAPRMMVVTIKHDGGEHTRTYRGFVSTYAETTTEKFKRYTDEEWRTEIATKPPAPPAWLQPIVK